MDGHYLLDGVAHLRARSGDSLLAVADGSQGAEVEDLAGGIGGRQLRPPSPPAAAVGFKCRLPDQRFGEVFAQAWSRHLAGASDYLDPGLRLNDGGHSGGSSLKWGDARGDRHHL